MIRLLKFSSLFSRRTHFIPSNLKSFSTLTALEIEEMQNQITKASDIRSVLKIADSTDELSVHTIALNRIGKFINLDNEYRKFLSKETYESIIENIKINYDTLDPNELLDITFFLRVTNSNELGNHEIKIFERVSEIASSKHLEAKWFANIFFDWSVLQKSSQALDAAVLKLLKDKNSGANWSDINQFLIALTKYRHCYFNEIADILISKVLKEDIDDIGISKAIELMSTLSELNTIYPESSAWKAIDRIQTYLIKLRDTISGKNLIKLLEFFLNTKKCNTPLLSISMEGLEEMPTKSSKYWKEEIMEILSIIEMFCTRTGYSVPQKVVDNILELDFSSEDNLKISQLCKYLGEITNTVPKSHLNMFKKTAKSNLHVIDYMNLVLGLSKLDPKFDLNFYIEENMDELEIKIARATMGEKILLVSLIHRLQVSSQEESLQTVTNFINDCLSEGINDMTSAMKFIKIFNKHNIEDSHREKFSPVIKHTMQVISDNWDDQTPWYGLHVLVQICKGNEDFFGKIIRSKRITKSSVDTVFDRVKGEISLKAINVMFSVLERHPFRLSQAQCMKFVNRNSDVEDVKKLISKLHPLDLISALDYESFNSSYYQFFETIYRKNLLPKMQPFLENLSENLSESFINDHKGLFLCSMMAKLKILDTSIGLDLLEIHKDSDDISSLIRVAASLESIPSELYKRILKRVFTTDPERSFKSVSNKIIDYLYWMKYGGQEEDDFIFEIKEVISNLKDHEYETLLEILNTFPKNYRGPHEKLAKEFLVGCANKLAALTGNLRAKEKVEALETISKIATIEDQEPFKIILESFGSKLQYDELRSIARAFTKKGINDERLFKSIFKKIMKNPQDYLDDAPMLVRAIGELGLQNNEWANTLISTLSQEIYNSNYQFPNKNTYVQWIWGLINFNTSKEIIEKAIKDFNSLPGKADFNLYLLNLCNYFNENPYSIRMKLASPLSELNTFVDPLRDFGIFPKGVANLDQILQWNFNIIAKQNTAIEKVWTPYYIPALKTSIWPITREILLFNGQDFRGTFLKHKAFLEKQCKVVTIDQDKLISKDNDFIENLLKENKVI